MKNQTKFSKSRIMSIAWSLYRNAKSAMYLKGRAMKSFGHYLALAWKAIKKWSGKIGEKVEIAYQITSKNLNGFEVTQDRVLGIVIRS